LKSTRWSKFGDSFGFGSFLTVFIQEPVIYHIVPD